MKRAILIFALLSILAAAGFFAYKLYQKDGSEDGEKADDGKDTGPKLPPASTPPTFPVGGITAGGSGVTTTTAPAGNLYQTDAGPGGAAVAKRVAEIQGSPAALAAIRAKVDVSGGLLAGVEYVPGMIESEIAGSTGAAGLEKLPLLLTSVQRQAVAGLAGLTYSGPGYWADLKKMANSLAAVKASTGVSILPAQYMDPNQLTPLQQLVGSKVGSITKPLGGIDTGKATAGTKKLLAQFGRLGQNWLNLSDEMTKEVEEKAIQDLRASGWRFVGYDAPV